MNFHQLLRHFIETRNAHFSLNNQSYNIIGCSNIRIEFDDCDWQLLKRILQKNETNYTTAIVQRLS